MPKNYSQQTRSEVIAARKDGLSWSAIVRKVRAIRSRNAAKKIWDKFVATGDTANLPVSGRPPVLSQRMKNRIDAALAKDPWLTPEEVVKKLRLPVTARLVRAYRAANYHPVKGVGRPVLSARNKQARLNWCRKHQNDRFEDTLYTDEKSFFLYEVTRSAWVKRGQDLPFRTQPAHPPQVQVFGGISRRGRTKLIIFSGWLNGAKHRQNLDAIVPSARHLFPNGFRYLQDNDPSHTDRRSLRHLETMVPAVQKIPAQSPDFNAVEHVWSALDRRVAAHRPQTVAELERAVRLEWARVTVEDCNRFIDGVRPTMMAVIAAGGAHVAPADIRRYRA